MLKKSVEVGISKGISKQAESYIGKLVEWGISKYKDKTAKDKIDTGEVFEKYLKKTIEKYSSVKTLLYRNAAKYIYDFYEHNYLYLGGIKYDARNIKNLIDEHRFSILAGLGGTGKSMLMRHFFLDTIENTNLIPVFIELKEIGDNNPSLFILICNTLKKFGFPYGQDYVKYALNHGWFMLLLDGYDEIMRNEDYVTLKDIKDFSDEYVSNYFIISSRPNKELNSLSRFAVFRVSPLEKHQSVNLIRKLDYDTKIKARFLSALDEKLYRQHESFASNPLLLTIMLMTFRNYAVIPDKVHIFYRRAFDTVYSEHDAAKEGYIRPHKSELDEDTFKKALAEFCYRSFAKGQSIFSNDELRIYMRKINCLQGTNIEHFIKDLKDVVCVLVDEGYEECIFTHRSWQEYFTAVYVNIVSEDRQKKFFEKNPLKNTYSITGMLFDMNQEMIERVAIIPYLENKLAFAEKHVNSYGLGLLKDDIRIVEYPNQEFTFIFTCFTYTWVSFIKSKYKITTSQEMSEEDVNYDYWYSETEAAYIYGAHYYNELYSLEDLEKKTELYNLCAYRNNPLDQFYNKLKSLLEELKQKHALLEADDYD